MFLLFKLKISMCNSPFTQHYCSFRAAFLKCSHWFDIRDFSWQIFGLNPKYCCKNHSNQDHNKMEYFQYWYFSPLGATIEACSVAWPYMEEKSCLKVIQLYSWATRLSIVYCMKKEKPSDTYLHQSISPIRYLTRGTIRLASRLSWRTKIYSAIWHAMTVGFSILQWCEETD